MMHLHLLLPAMLVPAKLLGEASRRIHMPAVIGEIITGLVLGSAFLGIIPSEAQNPRNYDLLKELAQIGLCVLLFKVGLETRFADFLPVWRSATSVAIAGMVFSFVLCWGVLYFLGFSQSVAVFTGATFTATSIGITIAVLSELKLQSSQEGRILFGAAVIDDLLGMILLTILVSFFTPGLSTAGNVIRSLLNALVFIFGSLSIAPFIVHLIVRISRWSNRKETLFVLAVSFFLILAYLAKLAGFDMIIGAYAAGLAFARYPDREQLKTELDPLIGLLTPLFFIMLGASIEFIGFNPLDPAGRQAWNYAIILFLIAVISKIISPAFIHKIHVNRGVIGSGMIPRGEVGFVFAHIGLNTGVFAKTFFSSIVLVLMATTFIGPLLLRLFLKNKFRIFR